MNPLEALAPEIAAERKRLALDQVLQSHTFRRSDQLRNFLRYVCEMEIAGRATDINEYLIGVDALGRGAGYSPSVDSSVRSRAYELRQKLQKYYTSECTDPELQIEISKGSYVPRFLSGAGAEGESSRDGAALTEVVPDALMVGVHRGNQAERRPTRRTVLAFLSGALLAAGLVILGGTFFLRRSGATQTFASGGRASGVDPIVREAWGPLVRPDGNVLLSFGTNLFLLIRPFLPPMGEDIRRYPVPPELYSLFRSHRPLPSGTRLEMHPTDNAVALGEMRGIVQAADVLRQAGTHFEILSEQSAPLAAMRDRNVILFGISFSSQATTDLMAEFPFDLHFNKQVNDIVIDDPDGKTVFVPSRDADGKYNTLFGLVTVLPNGEGKRTVIISGITSYGSEGAMDFFASAEGLRTLRSHLVKSGAKGFPAAYQAVVRCSSSNLFHPCEYVDSRIVRR